MHSLHKVVLACNSPAAPGTSLQITGDMRLRFPVSTIRICCIQMKATRADFKKESRDERYVKRRMEKQEWDC